MHEWDQAPCGKHTKVLSIRCIGIPHIEIKVIQIESRNNIELLKPDGDQLASDA